MQKILIVEDDCSIRKNVKKALESWKFGVDTVEDFSRVFDKFNEYKPDLILMDIALPFFDGYYWCSQIRKTSSVPIIFVSSMSDNMNIIMAINMGGDDYITKPFEIDILIAKIQAILRRTYNYSNDFDVLEHKGLSLNMSNSMLKYKDQETELTKNEFKILLTLLQNKGKIVSREKLMNALWKTDLYVDENTLTVNINRLRKKIESLGVDRFIETKVGMGYIVE